MFSRLFAGGPEIELEQENHQLLGKAMTEHKAALTKRFKPRYFLDNTRITVIGSLASVVLLLLAFWLANNAASVTFWVQAAALVLLNIVFGFLMRRPTEEGRRLLDEIEGLKLYMEVASKEDIARLKHRHAEDPPLLNAERFESLLPYALALDVEEAWTDQFSRAVGEVEASRVTRNMHWYHGPIGRGGLSSMTCDLGNSLSSQISSSSTPPGSSSGSGGGGDRQVLPREG